MLSFVMVEVAFEFIFAFTLVTMVSSWIVLGFNMIASSTVIVELGRAALPSALKFCSIVFFSFVTFFITPSSERF